jgi:hypothetical protein
MKFLQMLHSHFIEAINVFPEMKYFVITDPGCLVNEVDRYFFFKPDYLSFIFRYIFHYAVVRKLVLEQNSGQFFRLFKPDTSMAEITFLAVEQVISRSIVQINAVLVLKHKLDSPQGIQRPRVLYNEEGKTVA